MNAFTARNKGDCFFRFQLQGLLGCQIDDFSYHGECMANGTRAVFRDGKSKGQCFSRALPVH